MQKALSDAESAVARITTLTGRQRTTRHPAARIRYDTIARIVLSGPHSEAELKAYREAKVRDDLLARGVDRVVI